MQLTRWNPARDLVNLTEEFDRFNRMIRNAFGEEPFETSLLQSSWSPAVDISEDKDNFYVNVEVPGLKKDDVKISFQDGTLSIQGEKKVEREEKDKNYHRVERGFGKFERFFRIPTNVKVDQIEAKFENGLLNITVPKAEEAKPKEIEVKIK